MTFKIKVKTIAKKLRGKYVKSRRRKIALKLVKKQIKESEEPLPELAEKQKQEIKSYWSTWGIDVPLEWHRLLYGKTGVCNPHFIPEPIFHQEIRPYMNDYTFAGIWSDKAYMDFFIQNTDLEIKTARSIIRNVNGRFLDSQFLLISIEEAETILDRYEKLVIKPSTYTDTGKNVKLINRPFNLKQLDLEYQKNYVIQIPLCQHPEIARLNPSSVNTIRVNSVLFEKKAHVMSAFIKVGQTGAFADNCGHDRYFIGIREDGKFCSYAINHDLQLFNSIPSGYDFAGRSVPAYEAVCQTVEAAHAAIPHFGFAFWDVCVNEAEEPVIVEVNLRYPDTVIPQAAGAGTSFLGKYTDEIMRYINLRGGKSGR